MQQRYAISDSPVMQLRFKDMPIRAKPQCLEASMELGAGGMRAQPVKISGNLMVAGRATDLNRKSLDGLEGP